MKLTLNKQPNKVEQRSPKNNEPGGASTSGTFNLSFNPMQVYEQMRMKETVDGVKRQVDSLMSCLLNDEDDEAHVPAVKSGHDHDHVLVQDDFLDKAKKRLSELESEAERVHNSYASYQHEYSFKLWPIDERLPRVDLKTLFEEPKLKRAYHTDRAQVLAELDKHKERAKQQQQQQPQRPKNTSATQLLSSESKYYKSTAHTADNVRVKTTTFALKNNNDDSRTEENTSYRESSRDILASASEREHQKEKRSDIIIKDNNNDADAVSMTSESMTSKLIAAPARDKASDLASYMKMFASAADREGADVNAKNDDEEARRTTVATTTRVQIVRESTSTSTAVSSDDDESKSKSMSFTFKAAKKSSIAVATSNNNVNGDEDDDDDFKW